MKHFIAYSLVITLVIGACSKKKDPQPDKPPVDSTGKDSTRKDVRDSVYFVAKELYLWTDKLPSAVDFKPTSYDSAEAVMLKVRTYSPLGTNGKNLDRWSFAMKKSVYDKVSSGISGDFGVSFGWAPGTANDLRIASVYKNSDAGVKGVTRGWKVVSMNGVAATSANVAALNTALQGSSIDFAFQKPDGTQQTLTIKRTEYQINPVLTRKIIEQNGKKIGYVAFETFFSTTAEAALKEAFSYFKTNGVTELIFDERYNGGGYVSVAERAANWIVPQSAAGKLMYKDSHNSAYASWNKTKNFDTALPAENLNLSRVFFIATGNSASASELLINVLTPYLTVKIIGNTTYGKPAGYYPIPVMNYYSLPLAVKQVNANNYGDYYEGLKADRTQVDGVTYDWGDPKEPCVADALAFIANGSFPAASGGRLAAEQESAPKVQAETPFRGAVLAAPKGIRLK
jgi:carboxyl-terminal processing protease